jgi:hypothetical protein
LTDSQRVAFLIDEQKHTRKGLTKEAEEEIRRRAYLHNRSSSSAFPHRLYKMLKAAHADALCSKGEFGIGPLRYYTEVEQKSIQDIDEGRFITLAHNSERTILAVIGVGNHTVVYCTSRDPKATFSGYDACVEITQPAKYFHAMEAAITRTLGATNRIKGSSNGACHYQHTRIVEGRLRRSAAATAAKGILSFETIDTIANHKFLIKDMRFLADQEYRFAFELETDVLQYCVITEPALTQMCRRIV